MGTLIIKKVGDSIACSRDLRNMSEEDIMMFIAELEVTKAELLRLLV